MNELRPAELGVDERDPSEKAAYARRVARDLDAVKLSIGALEQGPIEG